MNTDYQLVYQLFPRSFGITDEIRAVISCFEKNYEQIKSPESYFRRFRSIEFQSRKEQSKY